MHGVRITPILSTSDRFSISSRCKDTDITAAVKPHWIYPWEPFKDRSHDAPECSRTVTVQRHRQCILIYCAHSELSENITQPYSQDPHYPDPCSDIYTVICGILFWEQRWWNSSSEQEVRRNSSQDRVDVLLVVWSDHMGGLWILSTYSKLRSRVL